MENPSLLQTTAPGELPSMRTFKIFKKRRTEPSTAVRCLQCACICVLNLGLRSHLWCHWWCLHRSRWTSMLMMMTWEGTCPNIFLLQALSALHKILLVFENILSTRSHFYRAKYLWPWKAKWTETEKCLNGKNAQIMNKFSFRPYNESFIDQDCSVKIAGHWPCVIFLCSYWPWLCLSQWKHKKESGQYSCSHWPHTWSPTDMLQVKIKFRLKVFNPGCR